MQYEILPLIVVRNKLSIYKEVVGKFETFYGEQKQYFIYLADVHLLLYCYFPEVRPQHISMKNHFFSVAKFSDYVL